MMFLSQLITVKYTTPGEFVLYAPFKVDFDFDGQQYRIIIPRGFITDFASVPKIVQVLPEFDVNGASANAAVLHDYLYCCNGKVHVRDLASALSVNLELTRDECDQLLRAGLLASGYSNLIADMFYEGVRAGGWLHWRGRSEGLKNSYDFVPEDYFKSIDVNG